MAERAASDGSGGEASAWVEWIFTAAAAGLPMEQQGDVVLAPGVGIVGDRYALGTGTWSDPRWHDTELTLIEAGTIEALGVAPWVPRRNVVVRGVTLSGLEGVRFRLGGAVVVGVRACTPCGYIERSSGVAGLQAGLDGWSGGLRCRVMEGGRVRLGDSIEVLGLEGAT